MINFCVQNTKINWWQIFKRSCYNQQKKCNLWLKPSTIPTIKCLPWSKKPTKLWKISRQKEKNIHNQSPAKKYIPLSGSGRMTKFIPLRIWKYMPVSYGYLWKSLRSKSGKRRKVIRLDIDVCKINIKAILDISRGRCSLGLKHMKQHWFNWRFSQEGKLIDWICKSRI